jgi:hypothetical protein
MDYWEYEIRSLVNIASVSVGIGKIPLCHYNLVWGKSGYIFDGNSVILLILHGSYAKSLEL